MLDMYISNTMRLSCCFRIEKSKIRQETSLKAEKKKKNEQGHFGQNAPFSAVPT
jgi:hypothetical protein